MRSIGRNLVRLFGVTALIATGLALQAAPASAAVSHTFSGGTLTIDGNAADDSIVVTCDIANVSINGSDIATTCAAVTKLIANGGAGQDIIDLSGMSPLGFTNTTTVKMFGDSGYDTLIGWIGPDTSNGGGPDGNQLMATFGNDTMIGGPSGYDHLFATADTNFTLTDTAMTGMGTDAVSGIEVAQIAGGSSANTIDASAFSGQVSLQGQDNNDVLLAGANGSLLVGGPGNDTATGGAGRDDIWGDDSSSDGNDVLDGGPGSDQVVASAPSSVVLTDSAMSGNGTDTLANFERAGLTVRTTALTFDGTGFSGDISFQGSSGNDTMLGGSGDDFFNGVHGTDVLDGNGGYDDVLADTSTNATVTNTSLTLGGPDSASLADIERVRVSGNTNPNAFTGSAFSGDLMFTPNGGVDSLTGNGAKTTIIGYFSGKATLTPTKLTLPTGTATLSGIGSAQLSGGPNGDTLNAAKFHGPVFFGGNEGADHITTGKGKDFVTGGDGNDVINSGGGADKIYGDKNKDRLSAGKGNDGCNGGPGKDVLLSCEHYVKVPPDVD